MMNTGFPKFNLAKVSVTNLSLSIVLPSSNELKELLDSMSIEQPSESSALYLRAAHYSRDKRTHSIIESIAHVPASEVSEDLYFYEVEYTTSSVLPEGPVPSELRLVRLLLDSLGSLPIRRQSSSTDFALVSEKDDLDDAFFPLPVVYPRPEGLGQTWPMDELKGIRGIKYLEESNEVDYSFILDRPTETTAYLSINLHQSERLDSETLSRNLVRSVDIARSMNLPVPKHSGSIRSGK